MAVHIKEDPVNDHRKNDCIYDFRNNDPVKIGKKPHSSSEQKLEDINRKTIKQIQDCSKKHGNFYIIIIVNTESISAEKSRIHINKRIKSEKRAVEKIDKKTAEKSGPQTAFTPSHQPHGHAEDQHQIRRDRAD